MMSWTNVKLITVREIRDQLRDRRTLFTIAVLPILLYPLLGMTFLQVAQFAREHPTKVWLLGGEGLPEQPQLVINNRFALPFCRDADEANSIKIEVHQSCKQLSSEEMMQLATQKVESGDYDTVIYFAPDFADRLTEFHDQTVARGTDWQSSHEEKNLNDWIIQIPHPRIIVDTVRDESRVAQERVSAILRRWRQEIVHLNLKQSHLPVTAARPFQVETQDVAKIEQRRARVWSKILPFVVIIWALTGAFHPAIDLCAGEKERGTLETLLSSPVRRSEIVWGKLLTVMGFSIATSILNLVSMGTTGAFIISQMQQSGGGLAHLQIGPPPLIAMAWLLLALIPIAALFSALSLAIASLAKSAKEGQYYLMPLLVITMPLMIMPMIPSVQLELGTSLIPVTGVMLLLRSLIEAEYDDVLRYFLPVAVVTITCCLLAIRWAIDQFNNESVLFRESERFDLRLWCRHLVRDRGETPTVVLAVMCGLFLLLIRFFASLLSTRPTGWHDFATTTVMTQMTLILMPPLLIAWILTSRPAKSLLFQRSSLMAILVAALLAVCLHPSVLLLTDFVHLVYPLNTELAKTIAEMIQQAPNLWIMLVVFSVVPAICEEIAFRGFILSGLRHLGSKWQAIVLSSLFFGLAHMVLQQSITATIVGCVIAYIAIQSGSLWPCMAYHVVHNAMPFLLLNSMDTSSQIPASLALLVRQNDARWIDLLVRQNDAGYTFHGPVVILSALLGVALLYWFRRLPYQPTKEEALQLALNQQSVSAVART